MWVAGVRVDDTGWLPMAGALERVGELGDRHGVAAEMARAGDQPYLIEFEFSDGDHFRWGTDVDGMVYPLEWGLGGVLEKFEQLGRFDDG